MAGKGEHHVADPVDRGVDSRRKKGTHKPLGLFMRAFPAVGGFENGHSPAAFLQVVAFASLGHPFDGRFLSFIAFTQNVVVGTEGVEHDRGIIEQMLAAVVAEADRVRKDHHREDLGQVLDRIEAALFDKAIDQFFGLGLPSGAQFLERFQRDDAVHHAARSIVQRGIRLE